MIWLGVKNSTYTLCQLNHLDVIYIYIDNPNINMNRCILIWPVQTHPFLHTYIYIYIYASLLSSVLVIYFVSNHSTSRAFRAHSSQILPNPLWNLPSQHFTNCIWQEEGSLLTIICTYIYIYTIYIYILYIYTPLGNKKRYNLVHPILTRPKFEELHCCKE